MKSPAQPADWRVQKARFLSAKKGCCWSPNGFSRFAASPPIGGAVRGKGSVATALCFTRQNEHRPVATVDNVLGAGGPHRSEEHTSGPQSLLRISSAGFCLKKTIPELTTNNE